MAASLYMSKVIFLMVLHDCLLASYSASDVTPTLIILFLLLRLMKTSPHKCHPVLNLPHKTTDLMHIWDINIVLV